MPAFQKYIRRWTTFLFGPQTCERYLPGGGNKSFRSHVAWAKRRNVNLKEFITQRCLKSTVVISLMVRVEFKILYSNSDTAIDIRAKMAAGQTDSLPFWVGIVTCCSLFLSVFALIANFTAFSVFNSMSPENAPIILRSSIGTYASQLPSNLVDWAYKGLFLVFFLSFIEIARPSKFIGIAVAVLWCATFIYVIHTKNAISHCMINTGAMGCDPILPREIEEEMLPDELSDYLIQEMKLAHKANVPLNYQYAIPFHDLLKDVSRGNVEVPLDNGLLSALRESKYSKQWHI